MTRAAAPRTPAEGSIIAITKVSVLVDLDQVGTRPGWVNFCFFFSFFFCVVFVFSFFFFCFLCLSLFFFSFLALGVAARDRPQRR